MSIFARQSAGSILNSTSAQASGNRLVFPMQLQGQHINYRMYEDLISAQRAAFSPRLERLAPAAADAATEQ